MNKQEYLDKRNALYDKAKKLIAENKLAERKRLHSRLISSTVTLKILP